MRESTSALTRVALLVLMTAAFAAVWNGDQQTQAEFIIARRAASRQATELAQVDPTPSELTSVKKPVTPTAEEQSDQVMQVTVELTLPADITPGRFRVVQSSGAMFTINVTATGSVTATPRNVYFVDVADGTRQCLIRIDQDDALGKAGQTATSDHETSVQ